MKIKKFKVLSEIYTERLILSLPFGRNFLNWFYGFKL